MGRHYKAGGLANETAAAESESESDWEEAPSSVLEATFPAELGGLRLDLALAKVFPQYSRSRLQAWLKEGRISIDGAQPEGRAPAMGGERVVIRLPPAPDGDSPAAQKMRLPIVHEDSDLIVIDKPAGLIVHPGAGNPDGTLMNGLLAHAPALRTVPRAGIVHRLDKDTSGLLVVAKNLTAQASLAAQLADRSVKRTYLAVVHGEPPARGTIDEPIGRDTRHRTRMAVTRRGKEARTHFKLIERFERSALIECRLETGRTHQIRVHLEHIKHPVAGDPVYRRSMRPGLEFPRQALHAAELELLHPRTGKPKGWKSPLPADMKKLVATLRRGS
jgi:23S rRNA pseudouridine1911/1915/1917 synthase